MTSALNSRFEQEDLDRFRAIEELLLNAVNGKEYTSKNLDFNGINIEQLHSELRDLPVYLRIHNSDLEVKIRQVTKIDTICDIMNRRPTYKKSLPNVHKLLCL